MILIPIGCRSDEGLTRPIIKRLEQKEIDIGFATLDANSFLLSYRRIREIVAFTGPKIDIALICGDRVEMCGAAAACFHSHIPIAHLYAGTGSNIATLDDINRHVITLWSEIQFCESERAADNVRILLSSIRKEPNTHVVGITHLDDIEIDEFLAPRKPYDLILYNPITCGEGRSLKIYNDVRSAIAAADTGNVIAVSPNPDDDGFVYELLKGYASTYHTSLPRAQFLGLLKNCSKFITNSSAAIYEAPHLLKPEQIIHIGERNRDRDKGPFQTGASDRIVEVLQRWYTA